MKLFSKSLFLQAFVLLVGCIFSYSYAGQNEAYSFSVEKEVQSTLVKPATLDFQIQGHFIAEVREEDDEEDRSFKRFLKSNSYPVATLHAKLMGCFFGSFNEKLPPFFQEQSYALPCRYLILQVFRL